MTALPTPADNHGGPIDVEIGIVNTNNSALMRTCLGSIEAACPGLRWRLTVLDNASVDGSVEMLGRDFPWARVIRNTERVGYATTLNQMIRPMVDSGSARYVALLHEDVELDPGTITGLIEACDADPSIGIAGPAIRDAEGRPQHAFLAFPGFWRELLLSFVPGTTRPRVTAAGWLDGPCLVLRVEALKQVGLFDERFHIFFEDVDMSLRMFRGGWRVWQARTAGLVHRRHGSTGQSAAAGRMELQILRSRYLYFEKHQGRARAWLLTELGRVAFLLRSAKARAGAALGAGSDELALSARLRALARYDPSRE